MQGRILKVSGIKGKLTTFDEESGVKCLVVPAAARAEAEEAARTYQGWRPRMRLVQDMYEVLASLLEGERSAMTPGG